VAHAAVVLENARLFLRMEQANRHWVEVFDAITDFIVVHGEDNKVLRVNRSLADFIGVKPAQLIGVSMRALVAMAADDTNQPCPFCRAGGEGVDEYLHPGLGITYLITTSRIGGGAQEGLQTIHVLKDITDRREAERRYRELFDNIQEGLFFSTPEGHYIEVNDALVRMLGYQTREELLQIDIATQLYLSPEQRQRFMREIEEQGVLRNYEETLRRKDGSLIHTLQNCFAVRDPQGRVQQYRGLMLDITEQRNFQAELQRQRDFNNKVLNNTQNMILVVDTAGLISYANRRCFEAGGYSQEDLLGRRLVELVPPGRRETMLQALNQTLAGGQVDRLELPILLGQGRGGQFSINMSPMRDEPGNVNSLVVVMTDITDAAMLQAKLMHTEKMAAVGQLVSGVAHEVNNPLTAILGFSDLLLEQPDVPEGAKKDLRIIMQEAQRTKQIVQNLLSFARQMPPQRLPVQLNAIVRRTLALRSYDLNNHGVKVMERLHEELPEIIGDSHQLQQVFLNILNNAYDAVRESGRPGRIEVTTACGSQYVEIGFRDNGPGVTYPERIFDPFFTTKEVGKGTGLGLSICYGIVREHGGEITCRNNPDEPGATFTVRLPRSAAHAPAAAAAGGRT
jgi:PAS domain S-box-containing protein